MQLPYLRNMTIIFMNVSCDGGIMIFKKVKSLKGEITIPGDKSISHRAIMFGALAQGTTRVKNFLQGADCLSTISCFSAMGIEIENKPLGNEVLVKGNGLHGLTAPSSILDVGNSGTTMRLISGILSGQNFDSVLTGDASIQKRPMGRVITPLAKMGAQITSLSSNNLAPLSIKGSTTPLKGITYTLPVASAQIKSAVLLAGLYGDSKTTVIEPTPSRNHTELMLTMLGASVKNMDKHITIEPNPTLTAIDLDVPGDISSAAFFIAAGLLVPNSEILIKNVGINPTRDGIIKVFLDMGADITILNTRNTDSEPIADLLVKTSTLHGTTICDPIIPALIDEIPIIAVAACHASGTTIIKDAQELKVKESNRLDTMVNHLKSMGADVEATEDGMIIHGGKQLTGAIIDSKLDHRIAMSFAIAGIIAEGETTILNADCVDISYPNFYETLNHLIQR